MKSKFLVIGLLFLIFSCSSDDDAPSGETIVGDWLVAGFIGQDCKTGAGLPGEREPIIHRIFKADGTWSQTSAENIPIFELSGTWVKTSTLHSDDIVTQAPVYRISYEGFGITEQTYATWKSYGDHLTLVRLVCEMDNLAERNNYTRNTL